MGSHFTDSSALGRTAPVYTFSNSGPRVVQVSLTFHRELMNDMNTGISNTQLYDGEDYVDNLIRALRSIAVPKYNLKNKYIEPPIVALRLANELFIKLSRLNMYKAKTFFRPWHIPIFINIPSFEITDDGIPYRSNKTVITRLSALYRCRTTAEYNPEPRF